MAQRQIPAEHINCTWRTESWLPGWGLNFRSGTKEDFRNPALLSELLWLQAEVCISTSVSKQLEEQRQKQDGSGPPAFNCDSAAVCACVSMHVTIQSSGFVCVCVVLHAAGLVWNNRAWTHTHTHTHIRRKWRFLHSWNTAAQLCHTHTHTPRSGQRKSLQSPHLGYYC